MKHLQTIAVRTSRQCIIQPAEFSAAMKILIATGLENRIMFGSDNGDIRNSSGRSGPGLFIFRPERKNIP